MENRTQLAYRSLQGLAIGDAFGENFWGNETEVWQDIINRNVPTDINHWEFTDDTVMGIAVYKILEKLGEIRQDELAVLFGENYQKDIQRGYGGTAHYILRSIAEKRDWREVSPEVFDGQGSMGNGASMRVAPLGAYFYDDISTVIQQAELSAEVTHFNLEGKVGAIAIAVAGALAVQASLAGKTWAGEDFLREIHQHLPDSDTKSKVGKAISTSPTYRIETVTHILGDGTKLLAQDTVPFALWCIAHHLDNFEEALWTAVAGLGDRDTICAIVGSVVILSAPAHTVPKTWQDSVKKIENSIFW
ncbi:MAG: ADP-ribosylglycohydrolase family protein [Bacteroidetes bacterium]|nr:MAG: ADP-ribosylglycohydrolase family protein [Bacteroidota bacterium]